MRLSILLAGCFLLGTSACGADETQQTQTNVAAAPYSLPHYKRPNLLVADLERSLEVYGDILGFSQSEISTSASDSFSYPVFNIPKTARMRYTYLGELDEARVFGLTEVKGVDLPKLPDRPLMSASVIGVTDLPGKIDKIAALGLKVTDRKVAGGAEFRFLEQAFVDFDGHLIVLYEILPD